MELELSGLNLERLLTCAVRAGIRIRSVRRMDARTMRIRMDASKAAAMAALCERFGWAVREVRPGAALRFVRWLRTRASRAAAIVLFFALTAVSSQMLLAVRVEHAGKDAAEVHAFLREAGAVPGRFKRSLSTDTLRERLLLRLPDLAYASVNWAGSTLVVDCRAALEGEQALIGGSGLDLVA